MGTSTPFGGQGGNSPLVPSWVGEAEGAPPGIVPDPGVFPDMAPDGDAANQEPAQQPPALPPIPPNGDPGRFTAARNNFSRFASSGGRDRASLGRAVSHYVGTSTGGARTAASRMGSSRGASSRLLGFLSDAATRGATEALGALDLGRLAGLPIEEIFLGLSDYICPDGGSVDEGIAREAFIETIADLAGAGITDFEGLTAEQMQTVFEIFATNAIVARLCNDIGTKAVILPANPRDADRVQAQLQDFIRRGVADALTSASTAVSGLTPDSVQTFVDRVYEQAFGILEIMGGTEEAA